MNYKDEIETIISGNEHNDKFTEMIESIPDFVIDDKEESVTTLVSIFPDRITCMQNIGGDDVYFDMFFNWLSNEMLAKVHAYLLGVENVIRTYCDE